MKFDKKSLSIFNSVINNVYFLYLIAFISFLDVIGYIMRNQYSAVIFFYLVGMLTFCYTKNMSVVLLTALIGTTLMHFLNNLFGIREGMKGKKNEHKNNESDNSNHIKQEEEEDLDDEEVEDLVKEFKLKKNLKNKKSKQGYQNNKKLKPSLYNLPNKDDVAKQLGKADKMEKAYDNLEKIVGEKGIHSMNESTKNLIKQQDKLLKGLKDITPSINSAMESIGKIDFSKLGGMFEDE
tara:strand:- start:891 stop:1601 length:711 start_codon:yes stop_codon:yes gene_type:complete